jgi:Cu/Ag efflux protein CusF
MPNRRLFKWCLSIAVVVLACLIMWLGVRYATKAQIKQYDFNGTVVAIHPETEMVRVHNQNMPGFMVPMDMDYQLKDKKILSSLQPGDTIHATLLNDGQSLWELQNVTVKKPH